MSTEKKKRKVENRGKFGRQSGKEKSNHGNISSAHVNQNVSATATGLEELRRVSEGRASARL
jgi:hypothetical protein